MKKLISLLLVAVMVLSFGLVNASAEEPVTIICYTNDNANNAPTDLKDDFVYQTILARTGVDFRVVYLDEYDTSLAARLMGGDDWHMFLCDADQMRTYAAQDMLLPLSSYTDMLNTIYGSYGEDTNISALYYDGEMYAIPAAKAISDYYLMLLVRNDWNEKYPDLKVPTTVDELYDYCHFLANNDPDGNGIKDTIGFTGWGINGLSAITAPYDVVLGNYVIIRDGKVTNTLLQPGMVDGLKWCKKFVDDKLIDPDCVTTSGADKFKAGTVGMLSSAWTGIWKAYGQEQIHNVNPNAVTNFFTTLKSEVGAPDAMFTDDLNTTNTVYGISADISDEKLNAMFKLIDYLVSDDGSKLVFYGLKDVHWKYDDNGNIVMTDRAKEANYISTYQLFSRKEAEYLNVKFPEAKEVFDATMSANRIQVYNSLVREPEEMFLSDMESYAKQELLNFIYGDRELTQEEYDKFIQELRDLYDFDAYMEAATEQLTAYGLVK